MPYPELAEDKPVAKRIEQPPIPVSKLNVAVDDALGNILIKSLSPSPQDRYRNAGEMLAELEQWRPERNASSSTTGPAALPRSKPKEAAPDRDAEQRAADAVRLARESGRLGEAADMLEEAIMRLPQLREKYEAQLKLWRRGVAM
jgi:hypothetical protein